MRLVSWERSYRPRNSRLGQPVTTRHSPSMHRFTAAFAFSLIPLAAQTPNVLLVVADDVGVDSIGCYGLGSNPPPTPAIDALAARGIRFANAQACPLCSPTRASVLTGRHCFRTGVGTALMNGPGLAASEVLLPEILGPAGVQTALMGKWHLGTDLGALTPTAEGFGTFTGSLGGTLPSYYQWAKVENGVSATSTIYATTDAVDEALTFVAATAQPWFLMLSFNSGHSPYEAPPAALHTQNLAGLNPATMPIPFFKAMVQAMDNELNRFLTTLPPATLANTTVIFLGDNGTTSAVTQAPFIPQRSKGTIYQGGIRVPLIVAGPAVGGAPRVESALVHAVDLFATIASLQGAALPSNVTLDTISATALLGAAGQPAPRTFSYSQRFAGSTAMAASGDTEMIRNGQFEVLRFVQAALTVREEMYDLTVDPWENTNLLLQPLSATASEAYRTLRRELAKLRGYAWSASYGTACSGGGLSPTLAVLGTSTPTIGTTFNLRVQGLSASVLATVGAIGFQNTTWNGSPLPVDLSTIGMTGCSLWVDPVLTTVLTQTLTTAAMPIVLPNSSSIIGAALFAQAFPLAANVNPAGILATGAIEAIVGG